MARHSVVETFNASGLTIGHLEKLLNDLYRVECPSDATISFRTYTNSENATTYVDVSVSWNKS
jgi:hypothetical protein